MANSGRITTGNIVRLLQYGLDGILKHTDRVYLGPSSKIFKRVSTDGKGFYETVMIAGMGPAGTMNQGGVAIFDSIDQSTSWHAPLVKYGKTARITEETISDNVSGVNIVELVASELIKSINVNDDMQAVKIFNESTTSTRTYRDGKVWGADDHPLQAGGTLDNRLTTDLTSDALESAIQLVDNFSNDDGILGDYNTKQLIVPVALQFVAARLTKSPYTPEDANNSINVHYQDLDVIKWKRLSSTTRYFVTTDCDKGATRGLVMADKDGIKTQVTQEPHTFDTISSARVRRLWTIDDPRCGVVCGT